MSSRRVVTSLLCLRGPSLCVCGHIASSSLCVKSPSYRRLGIAFRAQLDCPGSSLHLKSELHHVCEAVIVTGSGPEDMAIFGDHHAASHRLLIHSALQQISDGYPLYARLCSGQQESLRLTKAFPRAVHRVSHPLSGLCPSWSMVLAQSTIAPFYCIVTCYVPVPLHLPEPLEG